MELMSGERGGVRINQLEEGVGGPPVECRVYRLSQPRRQSLSVAAHPEGWRTREYNGATVIRGEDHPELQPPPTHPPTPPPHTTTRRCPLRHSQSSE